MVFPVPQLLPPAQEVGDGLAALVVESPKLQLMQDSVGVAPIVVGNPRLQLLPLVQGGAVVTPDLVVFAPAVELPTELQNPSKLESGKYREVSVGSALWRYSAHVLT